VLDHLAHGDHGVRALPAVVVGQLLQERDLEVQAGGGVQCHLVAVLHHIAQGVAAGGEQVTFLFVIGGGVGLGLGEQGIAQPPTLGRERLGEFLGVAQGQVPGEGFGDAVAVLALDLDLGQGGAEDVAVAMHVDGGVAVLTQHAAPGVPGPAPVELVVQVVGDEEVLLGVQPGLGLALLVVGRAVGEFHQALIGDADPLAAVVAGVTGLYRNTRIGHVVPYLDLGLAGALDAVDQHVALLLLVDGGIAAFVIAFVAVGDMAGGATHAAIVAALLAALDAHMAALTLLALIGEARQLGIGLDLFDRG